MHRRLIAGELMQNGISKWENNEVLLQLITWKSNVVAFRCVESYKKLDTY